MAPCRTTPSPKASCRRFRGRVGNGFTGRFSQLTFLQQIWRSKSRFCCRWNMVEIVATILRYIQGMQPDILWHLVLGVFFFPVGRFWILQKLGQVGLIDASLIHRSLTSLAFSDRYIQRKSPPSHTITPLGSMCVLNSTMATFVPPTKKTKISPLQQK